jgi:hypothetical protein
MSFSSSFSTSWASDAQLSGVDGLLSFERLTSGAEGYALAELEERKMMVAAKELLEQTHGLSEEAASGSARWRRSCFKASAGN